MNFIEELYYGNINPNEKRYKKTTPYDKALNTFTINEDKLKDALSGEHLKLFNELVNASDEISALSNEFERAYSDISRNGNAKIIFTDLCIKVMQNIRPN